MKLRRRADYNGTIRSVRTDDGEPIAVLGTVGDMIDEKCFAFCDARRDLWAVVYMNGKAEFYATREQAIDALKGVVYVD